jgi:hypothetical protein
MDLFPIPIISLVTLKRFKLTLISKYSSASIGFYYNYFSNCSITLANFLKFSFQLIFII